MIKSNLNQTSYLLCGTVTEEDIDELTQPQPQPVIK